MSKRMPTRAGIVGIAAVVAATSVWLVTSTAAQAESEQFFERLSTFPVFMNSADPSIEAVAEITAVTTDGHRDLH